MYITLASNNRITIPKEIVNLLNLTQGQKFEIRVTEDNLIILDTNIDSQMNEEKCENVQDISIVNQKSIDLPNSFKCKIVSNLEEGKNFSRKVFSDCGLLIRTKRSYIKKACEECQGFLVKQNNLSEDKCPYLNNKENTTYTPIECSQNESELVINNKLEDNKFDEIKNVKSNKDIIKELTCNVNKLTSKIDKKIDINAKSYEKIVKNHIEKPIHNSNTCLSPFISDTLNKCYNCGEYYNYGWLIDNNFYCNVCAREDFMNYYKFFKERKDK